MLSDESGKAGNKLYHAVNREKNFFSLQHPAHYRAILIEIRANVNTTIQSFLIIDLRNSFFVSVKHWKRFLFGKIDFVFHTVLFFH